VLGNCVGEMSQSECQALSGAWVIDEFCADITCEEPDCLNASVSQSPVSNDVKDFRAIISADDPATGYYKEAAANVQVDGMINFTVWGLEAVFLGGWNPCSGLDSFRVTTFVDDGSGLPGAVLDEQLALVPVRTPTGEFYAGVYELFKYDFVFPTGAFDHISVQSNSNGLNCWFLWMCSPNGDGMSSTNYGNGWFELDPDDSNLLDLSICIE
jgi:hypothetical protein